MVLYDPTFPTYVDRDAHWSGARDLIGDVYVKSGKTLTISCRVSFPKGAKLILEPEAKLVLNHAELHNACGDQWQGIECQISGDKKPIIVELGDVQINDIGQS